MVSTEVSLVNFFVYNPSFGVKDGKEGESILFYFPVDTDFDTQMKSVGLNEALLKFTSTFNPDLPCESLHTQKSRQLYFQPEIGFWMVMTISIPSLAKQKDGVDYIEYQNDSVQDNVYSSLLKHCYSMFRIFNGTFNGILDNDVEENIEKLRDILNTFYSEYLKQLNITHCDILDVFQGIQFLPLEKQIFLRVQCFANLIEAMFPQVSCSAFLYNDQLVWSGLQPEDMQVVYKYLVLNFLPNFVDSESSTPQTSPFVSTRFGRFLTDPASFQEDSDSPSKFPKVYLMEGSKLTAFKFIIYRALKATVCLFINAKLNCSIELFKQLDMFFWPRMNSLVSEISEYCSRQAATNAMSLADSSSKFVYFNEMNLAQKSTIHVNGKKCSSIPQESLKLIADINANNLRLSTAGETILKTMSDYWIIGKVSNLRQFYVVMQQRSANLIEINDEVNRLCDSHLKNIFFHV